jgi:N-acyl-L-homoserine lactone synthetase
MIRVISYKEISRHGDLFFSQFQLRHREFIDRQCYAVRTLDGMEFDQYDTLASRYIVYTEDGRTVLGCSRLTPIDFGCMLAEQFPYLVDDKSVFALPDVWEGSRFCIDSQLPPAQRRSICQHIAAAYIAFGLDSGIDRIIGLMPTLILRSVFQRSGIELTPLGTPQPIGAHARIQAAAIPINWHQMECVTAVTGLSDVLGEATHNQALHVA